MKTSLFCLTLWMLVCFVKPHILNFAEISPTQDMTTPMAEMASGRPSGGEGASGEGADALGGAFHNVAQGLLGVQEQALRDAVRRMEDKLRDRDEAIRRLRVEFNTRLQKIEVKVKRMEEQCYPYTRREGSAESPGHLSITQPVSRMDTVETILSRAFEYLFPNTEALITHFRRFCSAEAFSAVPLSPTAPSNVPSTLSSSSASTSTSPSSSPFPSPYATSPTLASSSYSTASTIPSPSSSHTPSSSTTSISTSASSPPSASPSAGPRPPAASDEERARQRVQLRLQEVRERWNRTLAAPSPLGEELVTATREENLQEVQRLLESGAEVNYVNSDGRSPLFRAVIVYNINEAIVRLLLEAGADANAMDVDGWTVLHYAAVGDRSGRDVTLLVGAGADVDARAGDGSTPLHVAAFHNNEATTHALLAAGARKGFRA